jgi:pyridoxine 4-dehydrogenase
VLAWLLRRSPLILPIPGTSSIEHLEENVAAASTQLTDQDYHTFGIFPVIRNALRDE